VRVATQQRRTFPLWSSDCSCMVNSTLWLGINTERKTDFVRVKYSFTQESHRCQSRDDSLVHGSQWISRPVIVTNETKRRLAKSGYCLIQAAKCACVRVCVCVCVLFTCSVTRNSAGSITDTDSSTESSTIRPFDSALIWHHCPLYGRYDLFTA